MKTVENQEKEVDKPFITQNDVYGKAKSCESYKSWSFLVALLLVAMRIIIIIILYVVGVFSSSSWNESTSHSFAPDWNLYRPSFHFIASPNGWMNDPSGPFYDSNTNIYHLFFQYNTPRVWGHAISVNLLNWKNLPIAINNTEIYNNGGVWSGSITKTNNGDIYAMYSVSTNDMICLAKPASSNNDSTFIKWINVDENNCIINASQNNSIPHGRDPTSSWLNKLDNKYYFIYGIETNNGGGAASLWYTTDWIKWDQPSNTKYLAYSTHSGIWECPDFFQLPISQQTNSITHVLKLSVETQSIYIEGYDIWILGKYNETNNHFIPIDNEANGNNPDNNIDDILLNSKVSSKFDYGQHFYASKSFYDEKNDRQLLYGWILEERTINADNMSEYNASWSGVMSLPREIKLLNASNSPTGKPRIITNIIPEFDDIMHDKNTKYSQTNITILNGTDLYLSQNEISGNNLDIKLSNISATDYKSDGYPECGIYVLCDGKKKREYTKIGLLFGKNGDETYYINTATSSLNKNLSQYMISTDAKIYGWNGIGKIDSIRIIVDKSLLMVEMNNGISVQTRRIYPILKESIQIGFWANMTNCNIQQIDAWNIKDANIK